MEVVVAIIDAVAGALFFAAAVLLWVTHRIAGPRTPMWAYTGWAFALFALDRGSNMLEWGMSEHFAWMDSLQGYLAAMACLVLVWLTAQFWRLTRQPAAAGEV